MELFFTKFMDHGVLVGTHRCLLVVRKLWKFKDRCAEDGTLKRCDPERMDHLWLSDLHGTNTYGLGLEAKLIIQWNLRAAPWKSFRGRSVSLGLQVKLFEVTLEDLYLIEKHMSLCGFHPFAASVRQVVFLMGEQSPFLCHLSVFSMPLRLITAAICCRGEVFMFWVALKSH